MSEKAVGNFLKAIRRTTRQVSLYPEGHPLTTEAVTGAQLTAADLTRAEGEAIIVISQDSFYLDRVLLPHISLEHNGLLRELQERGVDSITLLAPVAPGDLFDLAAFVAGTADDLPAEGTIRLNEQRFHEPEFDDSPFADLRRSYAGGLDSLRVVSRSMASEGAFELSPVIGAVEGLLDNTVTNSAASLLLSTVKSHDEYTFYHSVNTCILSLAMGRLVGLSEERLRHLGTGALLHDIGKIGVPQAILRNPGRLQGSDWETIKRHPQEGAQSILAASGVGQELASAIAFEHHSRFDGSGYPKLGHDDGHGHPRARSGRDLHLFSRLVSVSDTYDAITTRRSYRRAETPTRALNVLLNGAGTSYDPDLVRAFIQLMGVYPPGSLLQMSTGEVVLVVDQEPGEPERSRVVIVKDAAGNVIGEPEPVPFRPGDVVDQLLPDRVGVDPASVLEVAMATDLAA